MGPSSGMDRGGPGQSDPVFGNTGSVYRASAPVAQPSVESLAASAARSSAAITRRSRGQVTAESSARSSAMWLWIARRAVAGAIEAGWVIAGFLRAPGTVPARCDPEDGPWRRTHPARGRSEAKEPEAEVSCPARSRRGQRGRNIRRRLAGGVAACPLVAIVSGTVLRRRDGWGAGPGADGVERRLQGPLGCRGGWPPYHPQRTQDGSGRAARAVQRTPDRVIGPTGLLTAAPAPSARTV